MPQAEPVTETVDEVRDEFLETILDGFTKEELEIQTLFLQKLFDNTKKAIEGRDWS